MTIAFFSIQENSTYGWNVVKMVFPSKCGNSLKLSMTAVPLNGFYFDRKTAEVAAKGMAQLKEVPYRSPEEGLPKEGLNCEIYLGEGSLQVQIVPAHLYKFLGQ
jgi:hypothetical protein